MNNMLIILGAMKCGTTSLFRYLSEHPLISPCSVKEPNFFSDDIKWKKGFRYYDALWIENEDASSYRMEASVIYTNGSVDVSVINRMKESGRSFKFIYIVRDPFERIESHYTQGIADNWGTLKSTTELVVNVHTINTTMYFSHIQPYIEAFGLENILVLDFAQLKHHPGNLLKKVYDFLQIEAIEVDDGHLKKHNAGVEKRKFSSKGMWLIKLNNIVKMPKLVPKSLKKVLKNSLSSPVERFSLTEAQKQYIANELSIDYIKFSDHFASQVECKDWAINEYL